MTEFHKAAEDQTIPLRTLDQVKVMLADAKKYGSEPEAARLMLRHARLTDEARAYIFQEHPL